MKNIDRINFLTVTVFLAVMIFGVCQLTLAELGMIAVIFSLFIVYCLIIVLIEKFIEKKWKL